MANRENIKNRIDNGVWKDAFPLNFEVSNIENPSSWISMGNISKSSNNNLFLIHGKEADSVSLLEINNFIDKLELWVDRYSEYLTYPSSTNGLNNAIIKSVENESLEDFAFLYGIFHKEIFSIYKNDKEKIDSLENNDASKMLKNIFKVFEDKNKNNTVSETIKVEESTINNEVKKEEYKHEFFGEVSDNQITKETSEIKKHSSKTDEKIEKEIEIFNTFYDKYTSNIKDNFDISLKNYQVKRYIEGRIKEVSDLEEKNENKLNDWLANTFLLSLSKLSYEKSKIIIDQWPDWSNLQQEARPLFGLVNNEELLDKKVFWHSIKSINEIFVKNNDEESTKNLYQKVIPNIVSIKDSNIDNKVTIGKNILTWATKNENEFLNRLTLWNKMGGNITEINNQGESIVSWISSKNNDMWDKVIINFAKEKKINLSKNYPQHFRPKNSIQVARDNNLVNKPSPF